MYKCDTCGKPHISGKTKFMLRAGKCYCVDAAGTCVQGGYTQYGPARPVQSEDWQAKQNRGWDNED